MPPARDRTVEPRHPDRLEVDAVVVGGGPAGLAAATWLGRYRRSVLVLDSGEYRSASVERSHGYLGRDPQKPLDLIEDGRAEALVYPSVRVARARVSDVRRRDDGRFEVTTEHGTAVGHRLVLAAGVRDEFPDVAGFDLHYGASVFHCPACDGYETRDRDVVVLGWDPHLVGFSATLLNWAASVTVVTNGRRFQGDESCRAELAHHGIELVEKDAVRLLGERGALEGLELSGGRVLATSLLFFSVAHRPRIELAERLGCRLDDEGYVSVDRDGRCSVPGVYAAGDLTPGLQLVAVAAGSGVVAGVGAAQSLFGEPGAPTSPLPAPQP